MSSSDSPHAVVSDYGWLSEQPACSVPYILPVILTRLKELKAERILDLGCGNGGMCCALSSEGYDVVGCDADRAGIEIARAQDPEGDYRLVSVYEDLPTDLVDRFDVVISSEVVEHLFSPSALMRFAHAAPLPRRTRDCYNPAPRLLEKPDACTR